MNIPTPIRLLTPLETTHISGGWPTLIPDFVTDDFVIGGAVAGAGAAILLGYYARKRYHQPVISVVEATLCTFWTAIEGLKWGIAVDAACYVGSKIL